MFGASFGLRGGLIGRGLFRGRLGGPRTAAPAEQPGATPLAPGASPASRQRLHLSVVLSKLRPEQLSGLAHIMQTLQHEDDPS